MANKGITKYTVQESQNIQLGQCRTALLDTSQTYTCYSNIIIAITIIQDAEFTTLTAENKDYCIGTNQTDNTYTDGGCGDLIVSSTVFPAGITIYGRWNVMALNSGCVILYMSK